MKLLFLLAVFIWPLCQEDLKQKTGAFYMINVNCNATERASQSSLFTLLVTC